MFDLIQTEQDIRQSLSRKDLYVVWDRISRLYEKGAMPLNNYLELKSLMYDKMSVLKMLEDFLNKKS